MNSLNERLKELRAEKNITQRKLAEDLKCSYSTIALYETGQRNPDPDTLNKIADYFGVSIDYLLGRSDIKVINDEDNHINDFNELKKIDPELLVELCRAKELPEEERRRIKEFAAFEIEKFLKNKRNIGNDDK